MPRARFSTGWGIRRDRKAQRGSGAGGGGVSQRPPLPASAVEYWHSELGASAAQAVGQLRGTVLPAVDGPQIAPDPGYFNGRDVFWGGPGNAGWYRGTGIAPLWALGERPWVFALVRRRTLVLNQLPLGAWFAASTEAPATTEAFRVGSRGNAGNEYWESFRYSPSYFFRQADSGDVQDTNPHVVEWWIDPASGVNYAVSGVTVANNNSDATARSGLLGPITDFGLNGSPGGASNCNSDQSLAFLLCCSAKPTASEITALRTWAQAYWGVP